MIQREAFRRITTRTNGPDIQVFPCQAHGRLSNPTGGTLSGTMQFANTGPAANKVCAFMPSVRVPNFLVSLVWRQVPLRCITSSKSYFNTKNWQNRVNQNAITLPFNGPGDSLCPWKFALHRLQLCCLHSAYWFCLEHLRQWGRKPKTLRHNNKLYLDYPNALQERFSHYANERQLHSGRA